MVVKLTVEQIGSNWQVIKEALNAAPSPLAEKAGKYSRILYSLMTGVYQCWFIFDDSEVLKACIITTIQHEDASGNKNLLIYLVYSYKTLDKRDLAKSLLALKKYAKSLKCTQITGFTSNSGIISLVKRLNGNTDYTFFALNI